MANGKGQDGYGLVFLIFLIAAAGLAMAGLGEVWSRTAQRQKREELDFIGRQFVLAIESYRSQSPDGSPPLPQRLEDLLTDTRSGPTRRHLRRLFADPYSGRAEWGLIVTERGIAGIYSLAPEAADPGNGRPQRFVASGVE